MLRWIVHDRVYSFILGVLTDVPHRLGSSSVDISSPFAIMAESYRPKQEHREEQSIEHEKEVEDEDEDEDDVKTKRRMENMITIALRILLKVKREGKRRRDECTEAAS